MTNKTNLESEPKEPLYAKALSYLTRPFPDFDFGFIKPVRKKAVSLLHLKNGDRVLDAGCGSGGSFPFLYERVGATGEIVGIEISIQTIRNTKKRIVKNSWKNVQLIQGDAQTVDLTGRFDGLLMFAAPDIFASDRALENILPHLNDNARIVIFGAKISNRPFGWILNGLLRLAFANLSSSTPRLNAEPWKALEKRLQYFQIEEYFFGWMFLANGSAPMQIKTK